VALREFIEQEIRERGPIPFSRYMELCLYGPGEEGQPTGYYAQAREQFGKAGDFYTSSDVHAVFGRLLARQFDQMWRLLGSPSRLTLIELGPGRGLFAQDVFDWSQQKFPEFFSALRYVLVETSPTLRSRLQQRFRDQIANGRVAVYSALSNLEREDLCCFVVFANEFFDALPVEVLDYRGELRIGIEDGQFVERFVPASAEVVDFADRFAIHPEDNERVEVSLVAQRLFAELARLLQKPQAPPPRGFLIFIDYGYLRDQMLAGRHRGTVNCFRRHTLARTPYDAPGEQDITAHVNFTALASAARRLGIDPLALITQSQFLMGIGEQTQFGDVFESCRLPQEQTKVALQLKHLIAPEGMGESFQVLLLARGIEKETTARLSGLAFVRPADVKI